MARKGKQETAAVKGISATFQKMAEAAIRDEVLSCFTDMAVYRRLTRGGFDDAEAFISREYAPLTLPHGGVDLEEGVVAMQAGSMRKRSRGSHYRLLQELVREAESCAALPGMVAIGETRSAGGTGGCTDDTCPASLSLSTSSLSSGSAATTPYAVVCHGSRTNLLASYPCKMLDGYVVLWAESHVEVSCQRNKNSPAFIAAPTLSSQFPTSLQATTQSRKRTAVPEAATDSLATNGHPLGIRPLLRRFRTASPSTKSAPAPFYHPSTAAVATTAPSSAFARAASRSVCLQSVHIVKDRVTGAAASSSASSFALQSVFQPGLPTSLECYPRHMIHFGLLCYAAWNATSVSWATIQQREGVTALSKAGEVLRPAGSFLPHRSCRGRGGSAKAIQPSSPALLSSMDATVYSGLIPNAVGDAILILGLGGNVLGRCLDTILPSPVDIDIVELEPAVLTACVAHGQVGNGAATPPPPPGGQHAIAAVSPSGGQTQRTPRRRGLSFDAMNSGRATAALGQRTATQASQELLMDTSLSYPRRHSSSGEAAGYDTAPASVGMVTCFLQDAYAYLRMDEAAVMSTPPAKSAARDAGEPTRELLHYGQGTSRNKSNASKRGSSSSSKNGDHNRSEVPRTGRSYNLIFLDCYDPDREEMMHEGSLIQLCARRLCPGGVLLVNAHILPSSNQIQRDFLSQGFATVQVLRVANCSQSVIACIAPCRCDVKKPMAAALDGCTTAPLSTSKAANSRRSSTADCRGGLAPARITGEDQEAEEEVVARRSRFTVSQFKQLAAAINAVASSRFLSPSRGRRKTSSGTTLLWGSPFSIDGGWLQSCRLHRPSSETSLPRTGGGSRNLNRPVEASCDLRLWHHYS